MPLRALPFFLARLEKLREYFTFHGFCGILSAYEIRLRSSLQQKRGVLHGAPTVKKHFTLGKRHFNLRLRACLSRAVGIRRFPRRLLRARLRSFVFCACLRPVCREYAPPPRGKSSSVHERGRKYHAARASGRSGRQFLSQPTSHLRRRDFHRLFAVSPHCGLLIARLHARLGIRAVCVGYALPFRFIRGHRPRRRDRPACVCVVMNKKL